MLFRLQNVRMALDDGRPLAQVIGKRLNLSAGSVCGVKVLRRAVDARRKSNICLVYHVAFEADVSARSLAKLLARERALSVYAPQEAPILLHGTQQLSAPPLVIGAGPAGLIATLILAREGYKPVLVERGRDIAARRADVERFWRTGVFDPVSNVQFGLGGAGTFSDGKLTTRVNDPLMEEILKIFVAAGAPESILSEHKPHVGTDKLQTMVSGLVAAIKNAGGEVLFEACVQGFTAEQGEIRSISLTDGRVLPVGAVILACGHSARDTYAMLAAQGVAMEAKGFAIGLRVEHTQEMIDRAQYGEAAGHPLLGPADYALVHHEKASGRTAYSFCMCPGGQVVASASELGGVVTNGMSNYKRDSGFANSALVVNVEPSDCGSGLLSGVEFQRQYERLAYRLAGSDYKAPAQSVVGFLAGSTPTVTDCVAASYPLGVSACALEQVLPAFVSATLRSGIATFGTKLQGFATSGILTGVETRTSSPVRILRNANYHSPTLTNLYPAGEGAGYAGGIMSAALDGYHVAAAVIGRYSAN